MNTEQRLKARAENKELELFCFSPAIRRLGLILYFSASWALEHELWFDYHVEGEAKTSAIVQFNVVEMNIGFVGLQFVLLFLSVVVGVTKVKS